MSDATPRDSKTAGEPSLEELIQGLDHEVSGLALPTLSRDQGDGPGDNPGDSSEDTRFIVFNLGETRYAVRVGTVIEIATVPDTTPVPNVPRWIRGVTNLRGEVLAVLDLRLFLGLPPLSQQGAGRLLVTRTAQEELTAGLVVDAVVGVSALQADQLEPPTAPIEEKLSDFLLGFHQHDGRLLAVLDLEALLASPEMRQFEETV